MTPRKELFIAVKTALVLIPELELVDLYRQQFETATRPEWTAALIRVNSIDWAQMVEQRQEGECIIDILLFTKDGWMDQYNSTRDTGNGLNEIDLIDRVTERLQFLAGTFFKPLQLTEEEPENIDVQGIMVYRISFSTLIYRTINPKYSKTQINLTPVLDVSI